MFDIDQFLREYDDEAPAGQPAQPQQPPEPAPQPQQTRQPAQPQQTRQPARPQQTCQPARPQQTRQPARPQQTRQPARPQQTARTKPEREQSVRGAMPGVFGGGVGASPAGGKPAKDKPVTRTRARNGNLRARLSDALSRLPAYWGVDLALILITLAGIAAIIANWNTLLLAIAGLIFRLVRGVLSVLFLIASIAALALMLRRRRRRYYY